jgi:hypothetical protein
LGTSEGKHYARVIPKEIVDLDAIIKETCLRGARASEADLQHDLQLVFQVIIDQIAAGSVVNTPPACFGLSIKGVFNDTADVFTPGRHLVVPTVRPGPTLRNRLNEQPTVAKKENNPSAPRPQLCKNHTTKTNNQTITPGGPAEVRGYRLRIDESDPTQGVFFVEIESETETRVDVYSRNTPKTLMFNFPPTLTAGNYRLEVRGKLLSNGVHNTGILPKTLTVGPP